MFLIFLHTRSQNPSDIKKKMYKARILCCSAPHASAWIRALPTFLNKFSNLEWVIAMKRWLGIPTFNEEQICVTCHKQIMDIHGHHVSVCSVSGDRVKRHNALRDCFLEFCSNEPFGGNPGPPQNWEKI